MLCPFFFISSWHSFSICLLIPPACELHEFGGFFLSCYLYLWLLGRCLAHSMHLGGLADRWNEYMDAPGLMEKGWKVKELSPEDLDNETVS